MYKLPNLEKNDCRCSDIPGSVEAINGAFGNSQLLEEEFGENEDALESETSELLDSFEEFSNNAVASWQEE